MKRIHDELLILSDDLRSLTYAVGRYNPGIEADDLESLPAIAATMGTLAYQFNNLRIDTLAVHEKRQVKEHLEEKNEANPNS